jgi:hypothetical protein
VDLSGLARNARELMRQRRPTLTYCNCFYIGHSHVGGSSRRSGSWDRSRGSAPELHYKLEDPRRVHLGNQIANGPQLGLSRLADNDNHRRLASTSIAYSCGFDELCRPWALAFMPGNTVMAQPRASLILGISELVLDVIFIEGPLKETRLAFIERYQRACGRGRWRSAPTPSLVRQKTTGYLLVRTPACAGREERRAHHSKI